MTLSTTTNTKSYTGDNSTVGFSFPYLFYANGDLSVTVDGVAQILNTDYTVTGAGNGAGGTVTFGSAPATSTAIIIQRIVSYTQGTDFENFDGNPADVTEKQFDLLTMQTQQLDEQVDRAILAPIGTSLTTNAITGTIDSTTRVLTISTSGPSSALISSLSTSIDTILTGLSSGDLLQYNGTSWVNLGLGAADTVLQVNAGGTALEYGKVNTDNIEDGAITAAKITDDAVTLAKMAGGTDGNLITYDASGDPAYVATGTVGQVLTSAGAGAPPTFAAIPAAADSVSGIVEKATSAEVVSETADKYPDAALLKYHPGIAKFGFTINGGASPTITQGFGGTVTINRNSTGNYTLTIPTAITNMLPMVSFYPTSGVTTQSNAKTAVDSTTQFTIDVESGGGTNIEFNAYVTVFGNFA